MKANEVMKLLNISRPTLYRYRKEGIVKIDAKLSFNNFIYNDDSVYALIGQKKEKKNRKIISYSRVSTQSQKIQLKEQTKRIYDSCISRGLTLDEQFEDIKSGMSSDRPNFQKILQMVIQNEVELLVIENKAMIVVGAVVIIMQPFNVIQSINNKVLISELYSKEARLQHDLIYSEKSSYIKIAALALGFFANKVIPANVAYAIALIVEAVNNIFYMRQKPLD